MPATLQKIISKASPLFFLQFFLSSCDHFAADSRIFLFSFLTRSVIRSLTKKANDKIFDNKYFSPNSLLPLRQTDFFLPPYLESFNGKQKKTTVYFIVIKISWRSIVVSFSSFFGCTTPPPHIPIHFTHLENHTYFLGFHNLKKYLLPFFPLLNTPPRVVHRLGAYQCTRGNLHL